jgi:hypothetical protein
MWQGLHVAARSPLPSPVAYAWMAPGRGDQIMKSMSPPWVWIALARLCRDATCCDPAGHRLVELGLKSKGK